MRLRIVAQEVLKMIEVKNLVKKYGKNTALDNVSFTVRDGEILGLLGPNGAGKSTTMNIITGYLSATSGEVKISGYDILDNPIEAKKQIGYLPEIPPLYADMTVIEYLDFVYDLKNVNEKSKKKHLEEIMHSVKITDVKDRLIANLSKGYKQRVGLAQAMIGNPDVLILDEPTVGLDPMQIIEIRSVIKKLGKSHTVILSSHILQEVQAICDRVVIINKGRVAAIDSPENLAKNISNENKFMLRITGDERTALDILKSIKGVINVKSLGRKEKNSIDFIVETEPSVDVRPEIFMAMAKENLPILSMQTVDLSLEDIFIEVTSNEIEMSQDVEEKDIEIINKVDEKEEEVNEGDI